MVERIILHKNKYRLALKRMRMFLLIYSLNPLGVLHNELKGILFFNNNSVCWAVRGSISEPFPNGQLFNRHRKQQNLDIFECVSPEID